MKRFQSYWIVIPWWSVRKIGQFLWLALLGIIIIGVIVFSLYIKSLPVLNVWHTTILKGEYTTASTVKDFEGYLALEEKLFTSLEREVLDKIPKEATSLVNRYSKGSISDPKRWERAYNRSYELPVKNPKMGAILIHGMSDSPYSLHTQASYLQKKGVWVLVLRMPGHGTIPSGLINIKWQDMASVVQIGMKYLKEKVKDKPIQMMGYSTGAPLALHYTLTALEQSSTLPLPSSLVFYSPAIGVSPAAPLAIWQSRLGSLLGIEKLQWNSVSAEYDPFKYASFAVNAGDQVYRICKKVQEQLDSNIQNTSSKAFPPILSFASIVDSTVSVSDTIEKLYKRLPQGNHTLVLFDIRHSFMNNHLITRKTKKALEQIRQNATAAPYTLELITDLNSSDAYLVKITDNKSKEKLDLKWAKGIYSLSHLALPISQNDPLYGDSNAPKSPGIALGHLALYGENAVLQTSASALLRQRWNPFYTYTKFKVLDFWGIN